MLFDVLSGLKEIKICYEYKLDGKTIKTMPATLDELQRVEPQYITMPGWDEDITKVTSFDELPINAQNYIRKIEELTKSEVVIFSVGPDRLQTIRLKDFFK
jgi:adenylosuccinate synthase